MSGFSGNSNTGRTGRRQSSTQQQGQQTSSGTSRRLPQISFGKLFFWVAVLMWAFVVLSVVLAIFSAIGSCFVQVATIPARISDSIEENRKEAEEEREKELVREEKVKERRKETRQALDEISGFLTGSYNREDWNRLRMKVITPIKRSKVFEIAPYTGMHLPPVDLALAPAGTVVAIEDNEKYWGFSRCLKLRYFDEINVDTPGYLVRIRPDQFRTPVLFLESLRTPDGRRIREGDESLGSVCRMLVNYSDVEAAVKDRRARISLEKVFRHSKDFDRPVKIIDLPPEEIGGVPVYWDLVVRVYPAWRSSPKKVEGPGRWVPSRGFEPDLFVPRLMVCRAERNEMSKAGRKEEIEDKADFEPVWKDEEGELFSDGCFMTRSEEMGDITDDRCSPYEGQLCVEVPPGPNKDDPRGVTVRVVMRIRIQRRQ